MGLVTVLAFRVPGLGGVLFGKDLPELVNPGVLNRMVMGLVEFTADVFQTDPSGQPLFLAGLGGGGLISMAITADRFLPVRKHGGPRLPVADVAGSAAPGQLDRVAVGALGQGARSRGKG